MKPVLHDSIVIVEHCQVLNKSIIKNNNKITAKTEEPDTRLAGTPTLVGTNQLNPATLQDSYITGSDFVSLYMRIVCFQLMNI